MATQYVRQTAVPCTLFEIASGAWIQNDGLAPSGVRLSRGVISRASVLGVIIEKQEGTFSLDDGTRVLRVRSFDANPVPVRANVGDIVLVVGRPREYQGERYIVLEICKKLRDPAWIQYRRKELEWFCIGAPTADEVFQPASVMVETAASDTVLDGANPFERIIARIRELDSGTGADIEQVLPIVPDAEKLIRTLIEEGEVFEIRPGLLKVLE
jgi:hypothetical protein